MRAARDGRTTNGAVDRSADGLRADPHGGTYLGMPSFPQAAAVSTQDERLRANLRHATRTIRAKRDRAVSELDDWAQLRDAGAAIKDRTLRHLDHYLLQLEESVTRAGGTVHWAADAAEANHIVTELVRATGEREVVKVKSMATQEIGLNEALARSGIRAYETDLAELIVQLGGDLPSHILVPAIHRNRGEIRDIFRDRMASWGRPAPCTSGPAATRTARRTRGRSARSSPPNSAASPPLWRNPCRTRPRCAARASRCARSPSTSPRFWSTCASGSWKEARSHSAARGLSSNPPGNTPRNAR